MAYWLLVERRENWEIDRAEGFKRFGISERKAALADSIRSGDALVFYVSSGISAFSDVRIAASDGTTKLRFGGDYDTAYSVAITTKPHIVLERADWLPLQELASKLSFTAGMRDWRQAMRNSIRRLNSEDGEILVREIGRAATGGSGACVR